MEAEVAKHRINDLKFYMSEFKREIIKNYHLKEVTSSKTFKFQILFQTKLGFSDKKIAL